MAVRTTRFTVEGRGEFPFDMLRYDSCYPASGSDASKLHHYNNDTRRKVSLISNIIREPSTRRWNSFGWGVVTDQ